MTLKPDQVKVKALSDLTVTVEWRMGSPIAAGYYLIAWLNPAITPQISISEAWFNPDSIIPWWWNRAYSGDMRKGKAITQQIIAWAHMPEPPKVVR